MANSFLPFQNPTTTDEKLDTEELTVGANDVHRERVQIAGTAADAIAPVTLADGLLVNLGTNNDVIVSGSVTAIGPLTDAQLRATPVPVSGTVSVTEPVTVDAVDLDIRDLAFASDKVDASGSTGVGVTGTFFQATQPISAAALPLPAGAATLAAQTQPGVDIGDVTVNNGAGAAAVNIQDGGNTITVDGTITANLSAGTNTNEVVGDVAHDAAAAGNPVLICGIAQDMDDTAPPNQVSAENDATRIATDRDGGIFVHPHGPRIWSYHEDSSSALTDASVHAAPAAGLSLYVTDIVVSTGAATAFNIFFEEGASKVLGPWYLEAVNGRGLSVHFATPKKITAATALTVTTSAAIAHSIDVTGFIAAG